MRSRIVLVSALLVAAALFVIDRARGKLAWLEEVIENLEHSAAASDTTVYIARYSYKGETVYYVSPRCCDVPSELYDARGALLCEPDGGFTGHGDGRCGEFLQLRQNEKVIWRGRARAA